MQFNSEAIGTQVFVSQFSNQISQMDEQSKFKFQAHSLSENNKMKLASVHLPHGHYRCV